MDAFLRNVFLVGIGEDLDRADEVAAYSNAVNARFVPPGLMRFVRARQAEQVVMWVPRAVAGELAKRRR